MLLCILLDLILGVQQEIWNGLFIPSHFVLEDRKINILSLIEEDM